MPFGDNSSPRIFDVILDENEQVIDIVEREHTTGIPIVINFFGFVGAFGAGKSIEKVLTSFGEDQFKGTIKGEFKGTHIVTNPFSWDALLFSSKALTLEQKEAIYGRVSPSVKLFDVFDVHERDANGSEERGYTVLNVGHGANPHVPPLLFDTFVDP